MAIFALLPMLYALLAGRTKRLGELSGKSVLITGASQGLGRAIALECTRRGARLIFAVARDASALRNLAETIQAVGMGKTKVVQVVADLGTPRGLRAAADRALQERSVGDLVSGGGGQRWATTFRAEVDFHVHAPVTLWLFGTVQVLSGFGW